MEDARGAVRAGWDVGSAAEAFNEAAKRTRVLLDALIKLGGAAAGPLFIYANELEAAQQRHSAAASAMQQATQDQADAENGSSVQAAAGQRVTDAFVAMRDAYVDAIEANERAATAINALSDMAKGDYAGTQGGLKVADIAANLALGSAEAFKKYGAHHLVKNIHPYPVPGVPGLMQGSRFVPDEATRAQWRSHARMARWGGGIASAVFAGTDQALNDASNPNYSTGERVGRVAGQGASIGAAALAGAAIGSFVPGAGTAVGALAGLAVGAVASYGASQLMDKFNDGVVDMAGDLGDAVGDTVGDALDEIGSWF